MRTILITGADGNIGSFLAKQFLEDGYTLQLLYHNSDKRIKELTSFKDRVFMVQCDLTQLDCVEKACDNLKVMSGKVPEIIVHTASIRSSDFSNLEDTTPDLWYNVVQCNLFSTYNLLRVYLPVLKQNNYGRIVLFGSNVSRIGLKKGTAYAASKAAIANLTRSVAQELKSYDITINTVSPGPIKIDDSHFSEEYREFRKRYYAKELEQIPKKRLAEGNDIYHICKFLTDSNNSYISGEEFFVTGGKL